MNSILVTGGAGYIGSHTCLLLLEEGFNVFLVDSFVNSSRLALDRVKEILKSKNPSLTRNLRIFNGDIKDQKFLSYIFSEAKNKGKVLTSVKNEK